jgi:hypothetical protein
MFGTLLGAAIVFGGGLIVGWFLLPTPAAVQKFWTDRGWVDKVR